jgi:voltage-gated potassium channel
MRDGDGVRWRIGGPLVALGLVLALGTLGYILLEGWSWEDAVYMVVTTVSTVGFGEVHPLSRVGRFFTIGLILFGVGALFYAFGSLTAFVFEGHLTHRWEQRRMETRVKHLSKHFVLCGYGRVGRQIARELRREEAPFVVIDVNQVSLDVALADQHLVVKGNATDDDVLKRAGIDRARALITAIAEDAQNIFVTLSARAMRPDMPIVARANYEDTIAKLRRAGATRVVSPYTMAGQQMAMLAVRPGAVDFVETLLRGTGGDLLLEDIEVAASSHLCGGSIAQLRGRLTTGATLLAVRREGTMLAPPPVDMLVKAGDIIAVAGTDAQLRVLEELCMGASDALTT